MHNSIVTLDCEILFRKIAILDLSCRELARKAEVSPTTITNWIKFARINAEYSTVLKVAKALGCLPGDLIVEEDMPENIDSWSIELSKCPFCKSEEYERLYGSVRIENINLVHFELSTWNFNARTLKRLDGFRFVEGFPFPQGRMLVSLKFGPDLLLGSGLLLHKNETFHLRISGKRL
jgi:DNA-binding Xre family transcriptional regulator